MLYLYIPLVHFSAQTQDSFSNHCPITAVLEDYIWHSGYPPLGGREYLHSPLVLSLCTPTLCYLHALSWKPPVTPSPQLSISPTPSSIPIFFLVPSFPLLLSLLSHTPELSSFILVGTTLPFIHSLDSHAISPCATEASTSKPLYPLITAVLLTTIRHTKRTKLKDSCPWNVR